jgi:excisionase family DNA binding protein
MILDGNMERLIKTKEVALQLGLETNTVLRLARENKIPHFRYGPRTVRFKASDIHKYQANAKKDQQPSEGV